MPNLNISFTPVSPAPANGYRVNYWNVNSPSNVITVTPNPTSSPVSISGVAAGCYSGTVESACSGGQFSTAASFNACSTQSCLTGTTSATGNCSSGQTSTFTLSAGNQATVSMTGFYYSGSGTRVITGSLLDNSNVVIQNFTYTQIGSGAGSTVPASYNITTAGTYKLQVNQVNCSGSNGSGTATMTVGNCQTYTPPPAYYYYSLNEYACVDCALGGATKVGRSSTQLSTTNGTHYKVGSYSYVVNTEITPAPGSFDINLDNATATGSTCYVACGTTPPSNGTITIFNNGGSGASLSGFTPAWFFLDTGTIPLFNSGTATGTHSGYIGNFGVTVGGAMGGCLTLTVNGTMVQNLGISSAGDYTFLNVSIPDNATVAITLDYGACQ